MEKVWFILVLSNHYSAQKTQTGPYKQVYPNYSIDYKILMKWSITIEKTVYLHGHWRIGR